MPKFRKKLEAEDRGKRFMDAMKLEIATGEWLPSGKATGRAGPIKSGAWCKVDLRGLETNFVKQNNNLLHYPIYYTAHIEEWHNVASLYFEESNHSIFVLDVSHSSISLNNFRKTSAIFIIRKILVFLLSRIRSIQRESILVYEVYKEKVFSYTKYTKRKYCNRQKIRTRDFDESPRFRPP
ncbi:hypothetical protein AVEN_57307-1 [Araneus ventricosus]|uniref:Uncharacterized protein n=1 Tax=Araneus ventricosus TaxID=182803 RepID=A0A4Y2IRJ1_ARAVE|nr:hypothetical protein AVEN_57307-1 [Araneus ventricosus]